MLRTAALRTAPLCALLAPAALSGSLAQARDEPGAPTALRSSEHRFELTVPPDWIAVPSPPPVLLGYRDPARGLAISLTRLDFPNTGAWRDDGGATTYFDQVERGVADQSTAYRRLHRQVERGVPPRMDLIFEHRRDTGGETVVMRLYFFRAYTLILTVTLPTRAYRGQRRSIRKVVESFRPHLE